MNCLASFGTPSCHAQFLIMIFSLFVAKNWRHLTMHIHTYIQMLHHQLHCSRGIITEPTKGLTWEAWYDDGYEYQTLNPQKQRFFFTVWFINADWTEPTSLSFHTTIHKCPHLKPQICLLSPFSRFLYLLKLIFQLPQCHGCWEFNATPSMPPPLYPYFLLSCWALPSLKLHT